MILKNNDKHFEFCEIEGKTICVKGIGKLLYQDGYPIILSIEALRKQGIEVSILHVADELLKNGWSTKATINKLNAEAGECINNEERSLIKLDDVEKFCNSTYEDQREMIFQYLFGCTTNDVREGKNKKPLEWLRTTLDNFTDEENKL